MQTGNLSLVILKTIGREKLVFYGTNGLLPIKPKSMADNCECQGSSWPTGQLLLLRALQATKLKRHIRKCFVVYRPLKLCSPQETVFEGRAKSFLCLLVYNPARIKGANVVFYGRDPMVCLNSSCLLATAEETAEIYCVV